MADVMAAFYCCDTSQELGENNMVGRPLEGVHVDILQGDPITGALVASMVSGPQGWVGMPLPSGTYFARIYWPNNSGYRVQTPLRVVLGTDPTYRFRVPIELFGHPVGDDMVCACSGFFRGADGNPIANARLTFRLVDGPSLAYDDGVLRNEVIVVTDANGYAEVRLLRGCQYWVKVPWERVEQRKVWIPNLTWSILPKVVFPVARQLDFVEVMQGSPEVHVGRATTIPLKVIYTSGLEIPASELHGDWPLELVVDEASKNILRAEMDDAGRCVLTGLAVGQAAILQVPRARDDAIYDTPPQASGEPFAVAVLP